MNLTERRASADRRLTNLGPPSGSGERRLNMERRIFDIGVLSADSRQPSASARRIVIREGLRSGTSDLPEIPA